LQAKLLRVLETLTVTPVGGGEDRRVDVRVVAATSRDLRKMVEGGTFREDLFYRLNVVSIILPPLRERPDDIPLLVARFLKDISEQKHTPAKRVSPEVMRRFQQYRWPGNVRELRNTLESMIVLADGDVLTERDLPAQLVQPSAVVSNSQNVPSGLTIEQLERLAITQALEQLGGNRTHAAQRLGISVRTLQRKLQQYRLDTDYPSSPAPAGSSMS
jgi:transcriptional regulator with PAS, ATPase and Fis domain